MYSALIPESVFMCTSVNDDPNTLYIKMFSAFCWNIFILRKNLSAETISERLITFKEVVCYSASLIGTAIQTDDFKNGIDIDVIHKNDLSVVGHIQSVHQLIYHMLHAVSFLRKVFEICQTNIVMITTYEVGTLLSIDDDSRLSHFGRIKEYGFVKVDDNM